MFEFASDEIHESLVTEAPILFFRVTKFYDFS